MNSTRPLATYCVCVSAAVACAAAMAMRPPEKERSNVATGASGTAFLDCARIASERVQEPDLVTLCFTVADVPRGRDFSDRFDPRQLPGWRKAPVEKPASPPVQAFVH